MSEPKRIRTFRLGIARTIPRIPNDKETLDAIEGLSLGSLLIHYTNWAVRFVAPRPRAVLVEPSALNDPRWHSQTDAITAFLEKVKAGIELTPHLSLDPQTRGVTLSSLRQEPGGDRWADKDFMLNVMGYHHFHLGTKAEPRGHVTRTNDLLFARVSRDEFTVLGIFDHAVFERPADPDQAMTAERKRLWAVFDEHSARGIPSGVAFIPAMVSTSGHSTSLVMMAQRFARLIAEVDPKLDDPAYVRSMYEEAELAMPHKPRLAWRFNILDLGLIDPTSETFFVLQRGPG